MCYTASELWDELLKVASAWAATDRRGEEETSDEEAGEDFIDDDESRFVKLHCSMVLGKLSQDYCADAFIQYDSFNTACCVGGS